MKAKRKLSKILAILMSACMLLTMGSVSFAVEDDVDIEYDVIGDVDDLKAQLIINAIIGVPDNGFIGIAPASLACLFGHSIGRANVVETTHRHWSTSPRCRQITYDVRYCTRSSCNHIASMTQISNVRIPCCK